MINGKLDETGYKILRHLRNACRDVHNRFSGNWTTVLK